MVSGVIAAMLFVLPAASQMLVRALVPWSNTARPSQTSITVLPGNTIISAGESLAITADIHPLPAEAVVHVTWNDGHREQLSLSHQGTSPSLGARFETRILPSPATSVIRLRPVTV